jgi:FemAB family protein
MDSDECLFFRILKLTETAGLDCLIRRDNHAIWDQAFGALSYAPVSYSSSSIDYQIEYQRGCGGDWYEISIILIHDARPCGIWPLSLSIKTNEWEISSHGLSILPPIFIDEFSETSRKTIVKQCINYVEQLCDEFNIKKWVTIESFSGDSKLSLTEWHHQLMMRGAKPVLQHELFVDLSLDMGTIKSKIRKSYKSLISAGVNIWHVETLCEENAKIWGDYRQLHFNVSGRVTRSPGTWDLQHQAIAQGNAFLIFLRDELGVMVGGGYFNITQSEGVYGVGAYDRSLFDKPLGHVVQYRAIEEMKRRGLRWYKIGFRPYLADFPTEKELSIADFKQGFATDLFPQITLHNTRHDKRSI